MVATISSLSRQVLDFELFRLLAAAHNTLLYTDGRVIDLADSNDTDHFANDSDGGALRKPKKNRDHEPGEKD